MNHDHDSDARNAPSGPPSPGAHHLPDFLIAGAMKSGTTSLHRSLAHHPDIFLPDSEVSFFNLDEIWLAPEALPLGRGRSDKLLDFDRDFEQHLAWYSSLFDAAAPGQLLGEDSPTYLPSEVAPARIRHLVPDVRLIFTLRDPVARAYSHYWHLVRTGRARYDFETSLRFAPELMLERGRYERHLRRWLDVFPREQMLIVLFEDFVANPLEALNECGRFIGAGPSDTLPATSLHENRGGPLISHRFNLLINTVMRHRLPTPSDRPAEGAPAGGRRGERAVARSAVKAARDRLLRPYPPMADNTRSVLEALYSRDNANLSELIGIDVARRWPYMEPS